LSGNDPPISNFSLEKSTGKMVDSPLHRPSQWKTSSSNEWRWARRYFDLGLRHAFRDQPVFRMAQELLEADEVVV